MFPCHPGFHHTSILSALRIFIATVSLLALLQLPAATASTTPLEPELVKNIHTGAASRRALQSDSYVTAWVNDRCLVTMPSLGYGQELWVSDDTPAGMHLLADISPGPTSSSPHSFTPNAEGSRVFFSAADILNGRNLWVTDGTEAGTLRLTDPINAAGKGVWPSDIRAFRDGVLFHSLYDGNQTALWFSDGTVVGTRPLVVLPSPYRQVNCLIDGEVCYLWTQGGTDSELWRTDGTTAGTWRVGVFPWASSALFHMLGDRLYFTAGDAKKGWQIWCTDGTPEGTRSLGVLDRGPDAPQIVQAMATANRLFFTAVTKKDGLELWSTDGTAGGTGIVKNLAPGRADADITLLGTLGNSLCFTARTKAYGKEFWLTDGTPGGTEMKDIHPGKGDANIGWQHVAAGDHLYFTASNGLQYDLWTTDGTMAGTVPAASFFPERNYINPSELSVQKGRLSFVSQPNQGDDQPMQVWLSEDGTPGGIQPLLADISPFSPRGAVRPVQVNGKVLIPHGEIDSYRTDIPVDLISHDPSTGTTENLFRGSVTYFTWLWQSPIHAMFSYRTSASATAEIVLQITDGTAAGTRVLAEIPANLARSILTTDDTVWFMGPDAAQDDRITLWKTDGTVEGTVAAQLPAAADANSFPFLKARLGDLAIFTAEDATHGRELWRSDGTEAGTFMLKDIIPETDSTPLTIHGTYAGLLYFTAAISAQNKQLWRTDGTEAGTFMLKEVSSWLSSADPSEFTVMDGVVYFKAPGAGFQIWRTDGTVAGTRQATNIASHYSNEAPSQFTLFQGRLYFVGSGSHGRDIWSTDGTPQGTLPLSLNDQGFSQFQVSSTAVLRAAGEFLYWIEGGSLYRTDGTPGTRTTLTSTNFDISSLLVRPPMPGASVSPDQHVVFFLSNGKLCRCSNDETAAVEICQAGAASILLCGDRIVYTEAPLGGGLCSLWSSDGTAGSRQQLLPVLVTNPLLASTAQRLYYTCTDAGGRLNLECIRPDGSDRTVLHPADPGDVFYPELIEGEHVIFRRQLSKAYSQTVADQLLVETSGTLESTRQSGFISAPNWGGMVRAGSLVFLAANDPAAGQELHKLAIDGPPALILGQSAGQPSLEIGEDDLIELPPQVLHQPRVRTLHLRNTGLQALTDITFSAPSLTDFEIAPASIASLAPGAVAEVQITFTPQQTGLRETTVQFSSTLGASSFTRTLHLRGRGLAQDAAPENLTAPSSRLVLAGQSVTFAADILAPAGITTAGWQRTPGTALAETGPVLTLPAVQAEDVGVYTYHVSTPAGEVTTRPASLGVVAAAIPLLRVTLDTGFVLSCTAQAPPGSTLSYQWTFKNHPLRSGGRIQGSQTARLHIETLSPDDIGSYECLVTLHAPDRSVTLSHGRTEVTRLLPPEILVGGDTYYYIGQAMQYQVPTSQPADSFTFKGLPPGLTASASGLITGRPTKSLPLDPATGFPRPYKVSVIARNAAGIGQPGIVPMVVMSVALPGTYHGLIARSTEVAGGKNLGGRVTMTVAAAGGFSGQLVHGGKTYRFTRPSLATEVTQLGAAVEYEVPIIPDRKLPPLRLILSGSGGPDLVATLMDAEGHSTFGMLELQVTRTSTEMVHASGIYNVLLSPRPAQPEDSDPTPPVGPQVPGGTGYLVVNVAKSGTATWKGKLADGTAVTGTCPIVSASRPQVFLHSPVNKETGSLHGYLTPASGSINPSRSSLSWMKAPHQSRSYADGILLHRLNADGSVWSKPDRYNFFWDLQYIGYNLKINLSGPGLSEEGVLQYAGISTAYRVTLPLKISGNIMQKLSISTTTGLFKGSFRLYALPGPDLPPKAVDIPFEGAFTTRGPARGFFLLPVLDEEGWLPKTPQLQSGTIEFIPNTP
ncbi:ELWxxDGT repeat protein [Prosthecobacter fusiformis]|uniref:ELWxxDGT repeat protein n=1 Tax=Prosthecobacter fusiformis TaxID=48464 RepID=A0A4R7S3H6_9BACT|nr:hypothetical protein [Prosthecobacter fusiformis]TDU72940.1 ELWxxDGT repeat protein [Prosthecobacter fusiformis]